MIFLALLPGILTAVPGRSGTDNLPYALIRGQYMAAVASTEWNGVPVDVSRLETLKSNWDNIKEGIATRSARNSRSTADRRE